MAGRFLWVLFDVIEDIDFDFRGTGYFLKRLGINGDYNTLELKSLSLII